MTTVYTVGDSEGAAFEVAVERRLAQGTVMLQTGIQQDHVSPSSYLRRPLHRLSIGYITRVPVIESEKEV